MRTFELQNPCINCGHHGCVGKSCIRDATQKSAIQIINALQSYIQCISDPMIDDEYDEGKQSAYREIWHWSKGVESQLVHEGKPE